MIETLPRLHVGQGRHFGAISIFPVWSEAPEVRGLASSHEAGIRAAEREGSPVVGELVLTNPSPKPVLLLGGELFEGGWQHRALNHDLVLRPGSQHVANVSCVEHGRWGGGRDQVHRSRRASVLVRAAQAMTHEGDRQGDVWRRVSRYDAAFGSSATSSYVDHLDRRTGHPGTHAATVAAARDLRTLPGQRGVIIGLGGQPAVLELFPTTRALQRHLPALVDAIAVDAALLTPVPTPGRRARRVVERLEHLRLTHDVTRDAGDGRTVAGHTAYHGASGVVWNGELAHATVFNRRHPLLLAA